MGPLDELAISHCDLRPYFRSLLDFRQARVQGPVVFPPTKELTISHPMYLSPERYKSAPVKFAKSQHVLGIPLERVTIPNLQGQYARRDGGGVEAIGRQCIIVKQAVIQSQWSSSVCLSLLGVCLGFHLQICGYLCCSTTEERPNMSFFIHRASAGDVIWQDGPRAPYPMYIFHIVGVVGYRWSCPL